MCKWQNKKKPQQQDAAFHTHAAEGLITSHIRINSELQPQLQPASASVGHWPKINGEIFAAVVYHQKQKIQTDIGLGRPLMAGKHQTALLTLKRIQVIVFNDEVGRQNKNKTWKN